METFNKFGVGVNIGGQTISILLMKNQMTQEEALNLAAYLAVLADPLQERFPALLEAIQNS